MFAAGFLLERVGLAASCLDVRLGLPFHEAAMLGCWERGRSTGICEWRKALQSKG